MLIIQNDYCQVTELDKGLLWIAAKEIQKSLILLYFRYLERREGRGPVFLLVLVIWLHCFL